MDLVLDKRIYSADPSLLYNCPFSQRQITIEKVLRNVYMASANGVSGWA